MEYISRVLNRLSPTARRPHHGGYRSSLSSPTTSKTTTSPRVQHSGAHRHQKRKHHRPKMVSFNGPWSQDLDAFKKSVQSMPDQYKSSFAGASKEALEKICDLDVLHVWEGDSDIDNLLQLTSVIAKLCNLGTRKEKGASTNDGSMLIIAEEKGGRNNFSRICELVEYLTGANGKTHLDGTVTAFGTIVVVKGWNSSIRSDTGLREAEAAVKRISTSIERLFKMGAFSAGKKIVWHHGAVIHFLLHFINTTTSSIRNAFHAITVTGSLDLTDSVRPSPIGRANTLPDLLTLETHAKKLGVPVVFLDPTSQLITFQYLATYMYYYAYYTNTFLPPSLSRPHLHKAQDDLVTFAFQLLGASKSKYEDSVVRIVKDHLDPKCKEWARGCINPDNYDKAACRKAGREAAIHHAVQLADGPFALFTHDVGLTAFSRLCVGPAAAGMTDYHTAAPVSISFSSSRLRPSSPASFHVLLPSPSQDLEKVTNRIQGLMMAVLERVRQEKGNPEFEHEDRAMWKAVVKACMYALENSKGKMPKSVEEKVGFVKEKLKKGTWGFAMGVTGGEGGRVERDGAEGLSDAARANKAAVEAYGAGGNQYGQPQGFQQQMGVGFGQPQQGQQRMMYPQQQGVAAPHNSPVLGQALPTGGPQTGVQQFVPPQVHQGYGLPQQAHGHQHVQQSQQIGGGGFAPPPPIQHGGRSGDACGYPQSMGGNWL